MLLDCFAKSWIDETSFSYRLVYVAEQLPWKLKIVEADRKII